MAALVHAADIQDRDGGVMLMASGLPVQRSTEPEPVIGYGSWSGQRSYSANGEGVDRQTFRAS